MEFHVRNERIGALHHFTYSYKDDKSYKFAEVHFKECSKIVLNLKRVAVVGPNVHHSL